MNVVITDEFGELVAYITDTTNCIIKGGYNLINYGNNEPVFEELDGRVYVQENKFIMDLKE